MGNKTTESKFNKYMWPIVFQGPKYNILRNRQTDQEIQQYSQSFTNQDDFEKAKNIYDQRTNTLKNVVQFLGWEYLKDYRDTCATFKTAKVYTQRIPIKLDQVHNIPQEDCIFYMHEAMQGFNNIYDKTGDYVEITDTLIGFNKNEDIRVWINQDFSKNYPESQNHKQIGQNNEHRMVQKLFDVFQKHIQGKKWSDNFISLREECLNKPYTFQETISFLEHYIQAISQVNQNQNAQDINKYKQMPRSFYQSSSLLQMQSKYSHPNQLTHYNLYNKNQNYQRNQLEKQKFLNYPYQEPKNLTMNQAMHNNMQLTNCNLIQSDGNEHLFKNLKTKPDHNVNKQQLNSQFKKDNRKYKPKTVNLKSRNIYNPNQKITQQTQMQFVIQTYQQPFEKNFTEHLSKNFRPKIISKNKKYQKEDQRRFPYPKQENKTSIQQNYIHNISYDQTKNYSDHHPYKQQYQQNYPSNIWNPNINQKNTFIYQKQPFIIQPNQTQKTNQITQNQIGENQQINLRENQQQIYMASNQPQMYMGQNQQKYISANQPQMSMVQKKQELNMVSQPQIFVGSNQPQMTMGTNQPQMTFGTNQTQMTMGNNQTQGTYQKHMNMSSQPQIIMAQNQPQMNMGTNQPQIIMASNQPQNQTYMNMGLNQTQMNMGTNQRQMTVGSNQYQFNMGTNQTYMNMGLNQPKMTEGTNQQIKIIPTHQVPIEQITMGGTHQIPNQQMAIGSIHKVPSQQLSMEGTKEILNQKMTSGTHQVHNQQMTFVGIHQVPSQQITMGRNLQVPSQKMTMGSILQVPNQQMNLSGIYQVPSRQKKITIETTSQFPSQQMSGIAYQLYNQQMTMGVNSQVPIGINQNKQQMQVTGQRIISHHQSIGGQNTGEYRQQASIYQLNKEYNDYQDVKTPKTMTTDKTQQQVKYMFGNQNLNYVVSNPIITISNYERGII